MKKNVQYLFLSLFFLMAFGCGKDRPETTTDVQIFSGASTISNLANAIVIAVNIDTNAEIKKMSFHAEPTGVTISIPNGTWKFYGYGWETAISNTSQARCAFGGLSGASSTVQDIVLNGTATSISMEFTKANCGFGASGGNVFHQGLDYSEAGNFSPLRVHFCSGVGSDAACTVASSPPGYMQISFAGFADLKSGGFEKKDQFSLKSACLSSSSNPISSNFVTPPGKTTGPDFPFGLIIEVFSDDSCMVPVPGKSFYLSNGLAMAAYSDSTKYRLYKNTSAATTMDLFINYQ